MTGTPLARAAAARVPIGAIAAQAASPGALGQRAMGLPDRLRFVADEVVGRADHRQRRPAAEPGLSRIAGMLQHRFASMSSGSPRVTLR
jgi:hypothetical protein